MKFQFADRMERFQPGIFNVLGDKQREMEARGRTVYNLSIGTPDFAPEPHVIRALVEAAQDPEQWKYAIVDRPELLEAVRLWYRRDYGVELEADQIMSVYGSQEGAAHIGFTICNPGDIVLVPNPGYPIFEMGPMLSGAKLVYYDLLPENGFLPDLDAIDPETARAAKMMVVSFPANPVCVAAPEGMFEKIVAFARQYDILVVHDNAYSQIIFDGREGRSFLAVPGAMEVGIEFNSLSKTYNTTGARISFALGNREVIRKFRALRSQIDYGMFVPVQKAAVAALTGPQEGVVRQRAEYQARRDALCGGFRALGWNVPDSQGTMFVWAPIPEGYASSEEFCFALLEQAGVLCTPGSAFGTLGEGYVRFALTKPVEEIQAILRIIDDSGVLKHA